MVHRIPAFRFDLSPGTSVVYIKMQSEGPIQFDLGLWTEPEFYENKASTYIFIASFFGFLIVMLLYNTFLSFSLRSSSYTVYAGYIFIACINNLSYVGFVQQIFPDMVWWHNEGYLVSSALAAAFAMIFSFQFLDMQKRMRPMYWMLIGLLALSIICLVLIPFSYRLSATLVVLMTLSCSILLLLAGIISSTTRFRPAYFYTAAWATLNIGVLIRMLALYGILPVNLFTEWGQFVGTSLEVVILSLAMADKTRYLQERAEAKIQTLNRDLKAQNEEISDLNRNLEQKVTEKTENIRSILKSIEMGVFTIDSKQRIELEFSAYLTKILSESSLVGMTLEDAFLNRLSLGVDEKATLKASIAAILGEPELAYDLNRDHLKNRFELIQKNQRRLLQVDWNSIVHNGIVQRMLIVIKDVTEMKELEKKSVQQGLELQYISELIAIDSDRCHEFFKAVGNFTAENRRLIEGCLSFDEDVIKILFINMHTMKGMARSFDFKRLSNLLHNAEQWLAEVQQRQRPWDQAQIRDKQEQIETELQNYRHINYELLGRDSNLQTEVRFSRDQGETILEALESNSHLIFEHQTFSELHRLLVQKLFQPLKSIVEREAKELGRLARELHKLPPDLKVTGDSILMSVGGQELLRDILLHLLRNSMDHGLEEPSLRKIYRKPEKGLIEIHVKDCGENLQILYRDDGQGLNMGAIAEIAKIQGLLDNDRHLQEEELAAMIFEPGFTTTQRVSQISGRGVGMSAVRNYLEDCGEAIEVIIHDNTAALAGFRLFTFNIRIPQRFYVQQNTSARKAAS